APLARQLDRGRHLGDPAQHHRQARARAPGLMDLVLSEEQELLQHTAREFVAGRSSLKRIRALRDAADPDGFSRALWREMARLGWTGIILPEEHGGLGLGYRDLMVVMEELGHGLMPEPMLSTVLLGANVILLGGSDAQRREHLPAAAAGERFLALAWQEPRSRYDPHHVETRAERAGGGWRLRGEKIQVLDGAAADRLVVPARSAVMHAHRVIDEGRDDTAVARAASIAKARCSDAFVLIGNEGVQIHGGIGMTDEHDIGFFLKRARAAQLTFGDAAWHRDRMARLDG